MQTINIHEAKMHISRLVEQAAKGEPFVIAKAGKRVALLVERGDSRIFVPVELG